MSVTASLRVEKSERVTLELQQQGALETATISGPRPLLEFIHRAIVERDQFRALLVRTVAETRKYPGLSELLRDIEEAIHGPA